MTDTPPLGPTMRDLMATVGELLLLWGFLETAIRKCLAVIHTAEGKPPTKAPVLTQWRHAEADGGDRRLEQLFADIEEVATLRNCLAHGLSSVSANPWRGEEAAVVCVMHDGSRRCFTIGEMQEAKDHLHVTTNRVHDLVV
ncbi:hypothetical protein SAMN02927914_06887 [Mesorhizobium qingshengii]|uniref:Uncharacterized protein n=2 Tax=Mesorhizobium qingshengii TaxID=1165689 RepID=A0A1G5ZZK7_9HYPH|nr:hypothetical protein SAMN02927914_06887 [Mesorhizobium qingshengii]